MNTGYNEIFYRTYQPKYPFYPSDGNGRDTYIRYNNGGMIPQSFQINKSNDLLPLHSNLKSFG